MSWSLRRCSSQVGADWVLAVFGGGPTASTGQLAPSDCGGRRYAVCLQRGTPESADMSAADSTCTRQPPSAILGIDLSQPRTRRTTIVITLSNQQGGASDTCGQAERKAIREQASRNPVRSVSRSRRQPAVPSAACGPRHPGTWPDWASAPAMCRSARLALHSRRADVRHGAAQALRW
jgi:hypothetical protein